ncbi:MAG: pyridoxal phosphate-dependent aminotransferase [Ruminococcaceae bacterium]|nr:pyridoxal phosphate-dependent aminotransferase [Oscillospiraceae bacterium]MBR3596990.1 pyridoxal phosphate-dependent aminotransferase [Clostridia bacterium]
MREINRSDKLQLVHSDIRGPVFVESNRMRKEGIDVLRLNTGNPATFDFKMPDSVRNALLNNADKAVAYCDLKGMPDAREAICNYHKGKGIEGITPDDVFIGNGVSELVTMALTALLNYGDEILVPSPDYSLWTNSVHIAGAKPVHYICDEQSLWYPDLDDIKSKITSKTKAIVLINPNNPTGALYPRELLEKIVTIAREHQLVIFSDEIYDRLVMDDLEHISTATLCPDLLCITMNGLSKSHIVCGFRCGWMVVSGAKDSAQDFIAGLVQLSAMRLCANALMQLVIPAALDDPDSTRAMIVPGGRLYEQREACCRELDKIEGVSYVKNSAAFYIFPKLDIKRFNITDDQQFAMDYLHSKHVMIIPGRGFSWKDPDHFRIVMLPEAEQLAKAMRDLGDFLKDYRQN